MRVTHKLKVLKNPEEQYSLYICYSTFTLSQAGGRMYKVQTCEKWHQQTAQPTVGSAVWSLLGFAVCWRYNWVPFWVLCFLSAVTGQLRLTVKRGILKTNFMQTLLQFETIWASFPARSRRLSDWFTISDTQCGNWTLCGYQAWSSGIPTEAGKLCEGQRRGSMEQRAGNHLISHQPLNLQRQRFQEQCWRKAI